MTRSTLIFCLAIAVMPATGCTSWRPGPALPSRNTVTIDQLVIYSEFPLPQHHRLLEDLVAQRTALNTKLALPASDEPIHVYLFPTAERFKEFMHKRYPALPDRRAFFVESDTRLSVYAYWGDHVAEDLRHEVAHGYLHSVLPNLPLWLDEGLAEYFEVPRGHRGFNRSHVPSLAGQIDAAWKPNLWRLERLHSAGDMTQLDYAESWAWVHFLLETTPQRQQFLRQYLKQLDADDAPSTSAAFGDQLHAAEPQAEQRLVEHVLRLRQSLR